MYRRKPTYVDNATSMSSSWHIYFHILMFSYSQYRVWACAAISRSRSNPFSEAETGILTYQPPIMLLCAYHADQYLATIRIQPALTSPRLRSCHQRSLTNMTTVLNIHDRICSCSPRYAALVPWTWSYSQRCRPAASVPCKT